MSPTPDLTYANGRYEGLVEAAKLCSFHGYFEAEKKIYDRIKNLGFTPSNPGNKFSHEDVKLSGTI